MKNENHDFRNVAGLNPHKCLESDVGEVWGQEGNDLCMVGA